MIDHPFLTQIRRADLVGRSGRVTRILPTFVEADGPAVAPGTLCRIEAERRGEAPSEALLAEVVSVERDTVKLAPLETGAPTFWGARVTACLSSHQEGVGDAYLGRAIDPLGRPLDKAGPLRATAWRPSSGQPPPALDRATPRQVLVTGVRAIDGLLSLGQGQRIGVFAASGVGKTSLMNQLVRDVDADRCIVCLVGERGREVEALWNDVLTPQTKARTVLVAATSDQPAALRARAADRAMSLAEHWCAQGQHVLLFLDSVTRLAMALRETGLAAGEPPTVRAYTPGVFAAIPRLVERCGALKDGGSITAIMTVLSETDDVDDPICEMMKSLLDGHIVLSRALAEQGHFPAIDIPRSISRLASGLMSASHRKDAQAAVERLSTYETSRTLIESGLYAAGSSREIDRALADRPALLAFLRQGQAERADFAASRDGLAKAIGARS